MKNPRSQAGHVMTWWHFRLVPPLRDNYCVPKSLKLVSNIWSGFFSERSQVRIRTVSVQHTDVELWMWWKDRHTRPLRQMCIGSNMQDTLGGDIYVYHSSPNRIWINVRRKQNSRKGIFKKKEANDIFISWCVQLWTRPNPLS